MCVQIKPDIIVAFEVRQRLTAIKIACQLSNSDMPNQEFIDMVNSGFYISVGKLLKYQSAFLGFDISDPVLGYGKKDEWERIDFERYFKFHPEIFELTDKTNGVYKVWLNSCSQSYQSLTVGQFISQFCVRLLTQGTYNYSVLSKVGMVNIPK
jgi:hypothetical protein